jgi:RNA polymerase sigma-70 factor (ECF subfamily)
MSAPRGAGRSERRLAARLARGDESALKEIARRTGPLVRGYLVQVLRDQDAAEDVQQQVMLELWQRRGQYRPERASLATWSMTIARSRAIDHLRRSVPEPRDPQEDAIWRERVTAEESLADELAEQWRIAHLLTRLPREEAQLLRMRFHEELSQSEIAQRTGMALGTVKMRMVSGLTKLRELIEAEEWH